MDLRRWSDRKALRGLRWLLHTVYQDFPELCTRVGQDCKIPLETRERQKTRKTEKAKTEKCHRKIRSEWIKHLNLISDYSPLCSKPLCAISFYYSLRPGESDPCKIHQPKDNEKKTKTEKRLQPIRNMLPKVSKHLSIDSSANCIVGLWPQSILTLWCLWGDKMFNHLSLHALSAGVSDQEAKDKKEKRPICHSQKK